MAASGVFAAAYSAVNNVERTVATRINDARETANELQQTAINTIDALKDIQFTFPAQPPEAPTSSFNVEADLSIAPVGNTAFGEITSLTPERPTLEAAPELASFEIPEFSSSISSLAIPTPPAWSAPGAVPQRPDTGDVDLPVAPSFSLPVAPSLEQIAVPSFAGLSLPMFDATAPEFEGTALPGILQWSEPEYRPQIMEDVLVVIRRLWSGGSGIPAAVEQAMFERASSREDLTAEREIAAVATDFSSRGFTMPTGMQAARVDQMRQDLAVKKNALNRELTIQIAQWQIENIRFGVEHAIAAENVFVNIFHNAAQRMFEAARFQVESQINVYSAQVTLFNAKMNALEISARVYDTRVRAELSKIEVFKAEVEAEIARGQINEQRVRAYTAMVQALSAEIEIYRSQMQGAEIKSNVIRNQIEAYKADVSAYAEQIGAQKIKFDAYESQVKGEAAKAGIIDAEARAYAALVQGKSAAADIEVKRADLVIARNRELLGAYVADVEAEKTRVASQLAVIQANTSAFVADTQRFVAQAQAETAKVGLEVTAQEAEMRTNVALFESQSRLYLGHMEQLIRQAALALEALKSAGSIASTLAAGAMAGVHVGASLSGTGSVGATGADNWSRTESNATSDSTSHNTHVNISG